MEFCIFCQGPVEVTTGRCQRCGQSQPILSAPTLVRGMPEADHSPQRCPACGQESPSTARVCMFCAQPFLLVAQPRTPDRVGDAGILPEAATPNLKDRIPGDQRPPVQGSAVLPGLKHDDLAVPTAAAHTENGLASGAGILHRAPARSLPPVPPQSVAGSLSRRAVLVGLAGLAIVGGGVTWYAWTRHLGPGGESNATQATAPKQTPHPTAMPLGTTLLTYHGHVNGVTAVAWAPNGISIASGGGTGDDTVQVWEASTGTRVATMKADSIRILSLAWSPESTRVVSAAGGDIFSERTNTVQLWNALTGTLLRTYHQSQQQENVNGVSWSPDGKTVASASDDGTYNLWNPTTGQTLASYAGQFQYATAIAWSPDGKRLVVGTSEGDLLIVNPATGTPLVTISGTGDSIRKLSWSPDGRWIVVADDSRQIHLWDTVTGDLVLTYGGHSSSASAVAWSPDGTRIASTGDATVQLWNPLTGQTLFTYLGHTQAVTDLAWSPDNTRIASAGGYRDNTVHIWQAV